MAAAPRAKAEILRRAFDLIIEREEESAELITRETKYIREPW